MALARLCPQIEVEGGGVFFFAQLAYSCWLTDNTCVAVGMVITSRSRRAEKRRYDEYEAYAEPSYKRQRSGEAPPTDLYGDPSWGMQGLPPGGWDYVLTRHYNLKFIDRKSTRLNSSHSGESRMPSSA